MSGQKPREIAAQVLKQRAAGGEFVENLLETAFSRARLPPADRGLCQELVYGIVRWQATLDWLIARRTNGRPQPPALQNLLRLGLYQIFWLDRIPNHAAVHETVELAKRVGFQSKAGFVNAVLRGCLREVDAIRERLDELKTRQPHLGYSHPEWLVERWRNRWGNEPAARLMEWNNTPPATFARTNTLKADPGKLLEQWRDENVEYDFVRKDWLEENLVFELKAHPHLARLPSFQQGLFYIQDPSTLLAVRELDPQPDETVLDMCAAPGGKFTYIAQLMRNQGRLVAHDISPERTRLLEENCARLGIPRPPALGPQSSQFDRILIDAPCSNTGVMRRRVDLRWRLRPEEGERLRETQLDLLRRAAGLLKPGGTLVYSTCSLEPEENHGLLETFLREQNGIQLLAERELVPFAEGVDGAYTARMTREK